MGVNLDKPERWQEDIKISVAYYNTWFLNFAPRTFQKERYKAIRQVVNAMNATDNMKNITVEVLKSNPEILSILRMATTPPIAQDRLVGLSGITKNLLKKMEEESSIPPRMKRDLLDLHLRSICNVMDKLTDIELIPWKNDPSMETEENIKKAIYIIADRLCGSLTDPIVRNEQEQRQLKKIKNWLEKRGYRELDSGEVKDFRDMPNGTFSFRFIVEVINGTKKVNNPIDCVIMRKNAKPGEFPILFEAKSAGDFTNVNKRRKEEATKMQQLKDTYGDKISFNLFLCGFFNEKYLSYEAEKGIDWVWEHRIDDMAEFGI